MNRINAFFIVRGLWVAVELAAFQDSQLDANQNRGLKFVGDALLLHCSEDRKAENDESDVRTILCTAEERFRELHHQ